MLCVGMLASKLALLQTKECAVLVAQCQEPCMQDQPSAVQDQEKGLLHAA